MKPPATALLHAGFWYKNDGRGKPLLFFASNELYVSFGRSAKNNHSSGMSAPQIAAILWKKARKITAPCLFVQLFYQTACKIAKKLFFVILHGQIGCFLSIMPLQSIRSTSGYSKFFQLFHSSIFTFNLTPNFMETIAKGRCRRYERSLQF